MANRQWLAGSAGNLVSSLGQVFDPTLVVTNTLDASVILCTGAWRNLITTDLAANVYISGSPVNVTVASSVAVTGNPGVTVVNTVLPVSGVVQANITNTSPIPFSGVIQANITNTAPLAISGIVQAVSASASTVSNSSVSGINNGGFGVILPNNASRKQLFVQNLSTGRLLVRFSATLPTTGTYNIVLKGGMAVADGFGAAYESAAYTGPVSVTGWDASTPIQYISWEL